MFDQKRRGGLAVRAGDPDEHQVLGRVVEEAGRHGPHRDTCGGDHDLGAIDVEPSLHDQGGGPRAACLRAETMAVHLGTGHAEEHPARLHLGASIGQAADGGSRDAPYASFRDRGRELGERLASGSFRAMGRHRGWARAGYE